MPVIPFLKLGGLAALMFASASASAQAASAALKGVDGKDLGSVTLTEAPGKPGGVLLTVSVKGLSPGEHAFHVHAVGICDAPFKSAGGHFNPKDHKHGILSAEGGHAGDMPNLHVPASGELTVEILNTAITLEKGKPTSVFDDDGSAIVIHVGKDDYTTDPTGDAGDRVACGVIQ